MADWFDIVIAEPVGEPVSLCDVKSYARIDGDEDDTKLDRQITVARKYCEKYTGRAFLTQTRKNIADKFPADTTSIEKWMRAPMQSVTSITYIDNDGNNQTFASSNYQVDLLRKEPRIVLATGASWPATESNRINAVVVEYVAGYGTECSDVPAEIREAIMLMVTNLHDGCSDMMAADDQVRELLYPYKVYH